MRILHPDFDLEDFFARVSNAKQRALVLDYDGTLAPFHIDQMQATLYPGVADALEDLAMNERTRLVIVSGRWTRDLLPMLPMRARPEIWGVHGWERLMPNGNYSIEELPESVLDALVAADRWADDLAGFGAHVERKPASIAFHWRGQPPERIATIRQEIATRWGSMGRPKELTLLSFDGGMEFRGSGRNKGDVVRTLARESGGEAVIAYLGDDHTDEDGFGAVPKGGATVLVRESLRPTTAQLWLQPPKDLLMFLDRWGRALRQKSDRKAIQ